MKKNIIFIYLVLLLLFSCSESKKETHLGNNIYYIPFKEIIFDVTSFGGNGIYKCKSPGKTPIILPDIEEFKFNSDYIIVKQNFNFEESTTLIQNMLFLPKVYFTYDKNYLHLNENYLAQIDTSKHNSTYSKKFTKELLKNTSTIIKMQKNEVNYFIIKKDKFKIYGPLNLFEFENLKQKLNITLNL